MFSAAGSWLSADASAPSGNASNISSRISNFGGGVTLSYDAANGSYTVSDGNSSRTFAASTLTTGSNDTVSIYKTATGPQTDQLALFKPGSGNSTLALTHVSYGAWQTINERTGGIDFAQQYFVYGVRQAANAPSTGFATYSTVVDGFWTTAAGLYALSGTSTFVADFNAMTVGTTLDLTGTNALNSSTKRFGAFNGSGTIAATGGGFNGTLAHSGTDADGNVYNGTFNGAFFGPTGSEMGYTFRLTGNSGGAAVGAVVGKANSP